MNAFALSVLHEAVRLFWVLCAGAGFVGIMGVVALLAEPHFRERRQAIVVWCLDLARWHRKPVSLGTMPPDWRPRVTSHLSGAWRRP